MSSNGFADKSFCEFVGYLKNQEFKNISSTELSYWVIVNSLKDSIYIDDVVIKSTVTPICFSGPSMGESGEIVTQLCQQIPDLAAGFIQTRCIVSSDNEQSCLFIDSEKAYIEEPRTSYRIPLHLDNIGLKKRMKRDSKSRINKWFSAEIKVEVEAEKSLANIEVFARLYQETAQRGGFSDSYQFTIEQWQILLQSKNWKLLLVRLNNEVVGGSVLTRVNDGIEYVFMGAANHVPDLGRLVMYKSYQYACYWANSESGFFYLGGGITEGDALALFKISMGGEPVKFRRLKFVILSKLGQRMSDESIFARLKQRWPI